MCQTSKYAYSGGILVGITLFFYVTNVGSDGTINVTSTAGGYTETKSFTVKAGVRYILEPYISVAVASGRSFTYASSLPGAPALTITTNFTGYSDGGAPVTSLVEDTVTASGGSGGGTGIGGTTGTSAGSQGTGGLLSTSATSATGGTLTTGGRAATGGLMSTGDAATGGNAAGGATASTGGTSSGGCASTTGEPVCATTVGTGSPGLIGIADDGSILPNDGRNGSWYIYNDGTGTQTPEASSISCAPPVPTNSEICTSGYGFDSWGAGIGVALNASSDCASGLYDASAYSGVTFTISGVVQSGYFRFNISTAATLSSEYGGSCSSPSICNDYYGVDLTVTSTPQTVTYYFSQLQQMGWGTAVSWDPRQILNMTWAVFCHKDNLGNPTDTAEFTVLCISDVAFF